MDRENNSVNDTRPTSIIQLIPDNDGSINGSTEDSGGGGDEREKGDKQGGTMVTTVRISDGVSRVPGVNDPSETFTFDAVGGPDTEQEMVFFQVVRPIADNCLLGYNGTVFAYGQTGSGKTFTMQGPTNEEDGSLEYARRGVIPRTFEYIFERMREEERRSGGTLFFTCRVSYVEIYNEFVYDLFDAAGSLCSLREDPKRGVWVEGCREERVCEASEALRLFEDGSRNRHVAETAMNRESSRSHCVFTLILTSKKMEGALMDVRESRFNLVDLAGSERQQLTATVGARLKEAGNINKSLLALSNVINALVDIANGKSRHVHYRDSKLTFLLRDSLGGNAKTLIIAAISPSPLCQAETLSTLRFAQRAKQIRNKAVVNKDIQGNILELQAEVRRLRHENLRLLKVRDAQRGGGDSNGAHGRGDDNNDVSAMMRLDITHPGNNSHGEGGEDELIWTMHWERLRAMHKEIGRLKQLLESSQRLVQRREEQLKSEKMIAKFREASIAALEGELTKKMTEGGEHGEATSLYEVFKEERARLKAEIGELRRAVENHPEVTKYAYELMKVRQRVETLTEPAPTLEQVERLHRYAEELWAKLAQLEQEHRRGEAGNESVNGSSTNMTDEIPTMIIAPEVQKLARERKEIEDRYKSLVQEMEVLRTELAEKTKGETLDTNSTSGIDTQVECDEILLLSEPYDCKDKKRRVRGHNGDSKDSLSVATLEEQLTKLQQEGQEREIRLLEQGAKREEELSRKLGQKENDLLLARQRGSEEAKEREFLRAQLERQEEQRLVITHQRDGLAAEVTQLRVCLGEARQQLESTCADLGNLKDELRIAREQLVQYEQASAGLSPHHLSRRLLECGDLEERLGNLEESLRVTIQERTHLQRRLQQLEPLVEQLTTAQETVGSLHEELDEVRQELVRLRHENDKLVQHGNIKQKLQYHVAIKEENNAFREEIKQLREELTRLRQRNIELEDQLQHGGSHAHPHHHGGRSTAS